MFDGLDFEHDFFNNGFFDVDLFRKELSMNISVENCRREVKRNFKLWKKSGCPSRVEFPRGLVVVFDMDKPPKLMRFQHYYAQAYGFKNWSDLIHNLGGEKCADADIAAAE